ncbi:MAG: PAC2 family protein [archaeon]
MMYWNVKHLRKRIPLLKNPVFIEGLPGIGNVGKLTAEFLIAETKAKPLVDFLSPSLPHSVFVNEHNLVQLPSIRLFCKRSKDNKRDLLILVGDVQPATEESAYSFCGTLLDLLNTFGCTQVVTLGGIGLGSAPQHPKVYCTGADKESVDSFVKGTKLQTSLYGLVGPIIGITGLLVGLAAERKMSAVALLAETLGHPLFIGVRGAQEQLKVLAKKFSITLDFNRVKREVKEIEANMLIRQDDVKGMSTGPGLKGYKDTLGKDVTYIG